jgi:hypothetical protein
MKYQGLIPAMKVTVGGLAIKLEPHIFQQLVTREDLPIIHAIVGVFSKNHVYLTVHDGMTFFTKVEHPLTGIQVIIETDSLYSYVRL